MLKEYAGVFCPTGHSCTMARLKVDVTAFVS
jgi:hypothetical protein